MSIGTISEVWRYPVKSMGGERLDTAAVGSGGIANDRGWAVQETGTGKVASAKLPRPYRALLDVQASVGSDDPGAVVTMVTPDGSTVVSSDPDHARALTDYVGRDVTLARAETVDAQYDAEWPDMDGLVISNMTLALPLAMSTEKTSFVDLAALHLVSTASLAALRDLAPDAAIDVRRFRPNFVIDTGSAEGFVDTDWVGSELAIGDEVVIRISDNATRCVMTTLEQAELDHDFSVLQALATHNQQEFGGLGTSACLGVYAEVVTAGTVRPGDVVRTAD